jgi:hypothetical protein
MVMRFLDERLRKRFFLAQKYKPLHDAEKKISVVGGARI